MSTLYLWMCKQLSGGWLPVIEKSIGGMACPTCPCRRLIYHEHDRPETPRMGNNIRIQDIWSKQLSTRGDAIFAVSDGMNGMVLYSLFIPDTIPLPRLRQWASSIPVACFRLVNIVFRETETEVLNFSVPPIKLLCPRRWHLHHTPPDLAL